jgi:transcriptional regulator with XRE-family HTH domain
MSTQFSQLGPCSGHRRGPACRTMGYQPDRRAHGKRSTMTESDRPPPIQGGGAVAISGRDTKRAVLDVAAISQRIATRREQFDLKQIELARQIGMSEAYINRLENGVVRNPKILDLALVAQALDLPLNSLLYGEPTPSEPDVLFYMTGQPRLARALARLLHGLHQSDADEREHVISHLESLTRRFASNPAHELQ